MTYIFRVQKGVVSCCTHLCSCYEVGKRVSVCVLVGVGRGKTGTGTYLGLIVMNTSP